MAAQIQAIFIDPPIAVARLGGSSTPMDSFRWVDSSDPHLQTVIAPDWSLDVDVDGVATPRLPDSLIFRDSNLIRSIAPFFEVWTLMGENRTDPATWQQVPLSGDLMNQIGGSLTVTVDARNRKAARRARNPALEFGTFPPVTIRWDNNRAVPLIATSPPGVARPMIPGNSRGIPFGSVQLLRPQAQPPVGSTTWADKVRIDTLRFRFTPAKGEFYGPDGAQNRFNNFAPVKPENAFLDGAAGWAGTRQTPWVEPADTFDGSEVNDGNDAGGPSLGIVDDTCSITFTIELSRNVGTPLRARACAFVSPPDFAPDRRPFLSLADELNDRASRMLGPMKPEDLENWVRDLFERVYETISLFNLDLWRNERATALATGDQLNARITGDVVPEPATAMGGLDKLRDPNKPILEPSSADVPLPLTERANERHRDLAELGSLKTLVQQQHQRLAALIRPPFTLTQPNPNEQLRRGQRSANESGGFTNMQMPPFMRQSNANPLTISQWQYNLLMQWAAELIAPRVAARAPQPPARLSDRAAQRQRIVMARLGLR
jgi:hypothetical protein